MKNSYISSHKKQTFFVFINCLLVFTFYLSATGIGSNDKAALGSMMEGTAYRPFQFRVLVPLLIKLLLHIPVNISWQVKGVSQLAGNVHNLTAAWMATFIMFVALVITSVSIPALMERFGYPSKTIFIATLLSPLPLPLFFLAAYVYDLPNMCLFTIALIALADINKEQKAATWYCIIFILATLNKETSILLTIAFFVIYWHRMKAKNFWLLLAIQITTYTFIRFYLLWRFAQNPGGIVEYHLIDHINLIRSLPPVFLIMVVLVIAGIIFFVVKEWKHKPQFLRQALIMLVPLVPLYFFFGFPFEIRIFLEIYAVLFILLLPPPKFESVSSYMPSKTPNCCSGLRWRVRLNRFP